MNQRSILSDNQNRLLDLLSQEKSICDNFYLTGGTALAEFYLHHRLSEDLDFFSEYEFDSQSVMAVLKKLQKTAGIASVEYQQSFNRNLFFLTMAGDDAIKTEFTYFPFTRIEQKKKIGNLYIDSLIDIATNKLFTIYQNPRSRDFIDLYLIIQQHTELSLDALIKLAKIKFDTHIDLIQLGAQYMKAREVKDYPRMIERLDEEQWQGFFEEEAKKLSKKVFKK
jgi:predicted nucleotidyltransferase component of viral defense system